MAANEAATAVTPIPTPVPVPAPAGTSPAKNYKGFVAGIFSGIAKLSGACFTSNCRVSFAGKGTN